nr:hypothetical protein CFP56_77831 [Quercus suber]
MKTDFIRQLMWKKEFATDYVGFTKDGAEWLVENTDIKLVGVDYLNVAAYFDTIPSHHAFLEARVKFHSSPPFFQKNSPFILINILYLLNVHF